MAKPIRLTPEDIVELSRKRVLDGEIKLKKDDRRVTVAFTPVAWTKMHALVDAFNKEVQWHGIVSRADESTFIIEDILIFPHVASSTTVVSDQEEYEEWMDGLTDEQFNACRFHGHSHVNMGVTPSMVDMTYRKNIFENFSTVPAPNEDQYYIFLIFNKRREFSGQVYDITQNAIYETNEIDLEVLIDNDWLGNFIIDAKELVKDPPAAPATNKGAVQKGGTGTPTTYPTQSTAYSLKPETDDEWRERIYGGGKTDSADKGYTYPSTGFKGGNYEK